MDLWAQLPKSDTSDTGGSLRVEQALARWDVYHDTCGMERVDVDVTTGDAEFVCRGCGWSETFPLVGRGDPSGRHNRAALQCLAARGETQTLQAQTVMAPGPMGLVVGALLGSALRVRIAPYHTDT